MTETESESETDSESGPITCAECGGRIVSEPIFPDGPGIENRRFIEGCYHCGWIDRDSVPSGVDIDRDLRGQGLVSLLAGGHAGAAQSEPSAGAIEPAVPDDGDTDTDPESETETEAEGGPRPPDYLVGLFPFRYGPDRLDGDRWACLIGLQRAAERLGHSPSEREYTDLDIRPTYRFLVRTHGSFNTAKYHAGLETTPSPDNDPFTQPECYAALRTADRLLGHDPSKEEYRELGLSPSIATICRLHDGSWNEPKRRAGLDVDPRGRPPASEVSDTTDDGDNNDDDDDGDSDTSR
jgi:hypothetical protein